VETPTPVPPAEAVTATGPVALPLAATFKATEPNATPTPAEIPLEASVQPLVAATITSTARRGVTGRIAAILASGQQGGSLELSGLAFPPGSAGDSDRIAFVLDISGASLAQFATSPALDLEMFVYAIHESGDVVGFELADFHLAGVPPPALASSGVKVLGQVAASRTPKMLRILLREPVSNAFALIELPLPPLSERGSSPQAAPALDADSGVVNSGLGSLRGTTQLLAATVAEPASAWLATTVGDVPPDGRGAPFTLVAEGSLLSTRPVIPSGATVRVTLLGRWFPPDPELGARVEFDSNRPPQTCQVRLIRRLPAPAGAQFERLDVTVAMPNLPAGEHGLRLWCRTPGSTAETSIGTRIRVAAADKAAPALIWPAVPVALSERVALPTSGLGGLRSREEAPPHLKAAYRKALATVETDGAAPLVRELERASLQRGTPSEFGSLTAAETAVAKQLIKLNSEAGLALCLVHLELYRGYSRDVAYLPLAHSRGIIEELAVLLANRAKDAALRRTAADVLVTLGGELQLAGSRATSERLFLRALMIDARNSAALIGRAAIFERAGEWVQAVEMLEKLLVIDPSNAEARLRLGVCLRRLSRTSAARKALEAVTADLTSTWIRAVAWQELALAAVDRGDLGDAIRILQQGVTSVPDDLHLPVLLASTLDRQGRHRDARLAIRAVLARLAEAAPSARFQYSEWPSGDLAAARERLTARFPAAMAALDAALRQGVEP